MSDRIAAYISPSAWSLVEPFFSERGKDLAVKLINFVENDCIPSEPLFHSQISSDPAKRWSSVPPILETLKARAKELGLWNLWLSGGEFQYLAGGQGGGLSNLEYAVLAEISGHSLLLAPHSMNCSAPDTGNMEVLARFGTPEQKEKYLKPLLSGDIRSSFAMTERGVASSDATNLRNTVATLHSDHLLLSGHKWWISGAGDPRTSIHIVLAVTDPSPSTSPHKRHSLILVDPKAKGVEVVRPMTVFGYDDAPEGHCEVRYEAVKVGLDSVVGGKEGLGRGFEMIQARLGPGRLHHCMRSLGVASRALDLLILRATDQRRKTFGKTLGEHGTVVADVAHSRAELDQARLMVLAAARRIDQVKAKGALREIGMAKFVVPVMALRLVDRAMQVHGAEGISQDQPLAYMYAQLRTLRFADGPDEVHVQQIGKKELRKGDELRQRYDKMVRRRAQIERGASAKL